MQLKYLEQENKNLQQQNENLQTTLKINKSIIADFMKSDDPDIMYSINKA